jgi:hypothetical protein
MSIQQASPAVAIAQAHVEAWSNHDFDTARSGLAADVTVTATSTNSVLPDTKLAGIDDYMRGLIEFAQLVVPGSTRVIGTVGDERNALLLLTVQTAGGPFGAQMTLPAARLYLLDDNDKIKAEQSSSTWSRTERPPGRGAVPPRPDQPRGGPAPEHASSTEPWGRPSSDSGLESPGGSWIDARGMLMRPCTFWMRRPAAAKGI